MNARRIAWSIVGVLSLSAAARAGPVIWAFEGEVTGIYDPQNCLGGAVEVGSPLSGYYTFESTTPASPLGSGYYPDAITAITGSVGDLPFFGPTGPPNSIYVIDGGGFPPSYDNYSMVTGVGLQNRDLVFSINLRDPTGTFFSSLTLPLVPPSLDAIDLSASGIRLLAKSEDLGIAAQITTLVVVPEPTALALLVAGVALVGGRI